MKRVVAILTMILLVLGLCTTAFAISKGTYDEPNTYTEENPLVLNPDASIIDSLHFFKGNDGFFVSSTSSNPINVNTYGATYASEETLYGHDEVPASGGTEVKLQIKLPDTYGPDTIFLVIKDSETPNTFKVLVPELVKVNYDLAGGSNDAEDYSASEWVVWEMGGRMCKRDLQGGIYSTGGDGWVLEKKNPVGPKGEEFLYWSAPGDYSLKFGDDINMYRLTSSFEEREVTMTAQYEKVKDEEKEIVNTGDAANIGLMVGLMMLAGLGIAGTLKFRK